MAHELLWITVLVVLSVQVSSPSRRVRCYLLTLSETGLFLGTATALRNGGPLGKFSTLSIFGLSVFMAISRFVVGVHGRGEYMLDRHGPYLP